MKFLNYFLRLWFPKYYIRRGIAQTSHEHEKKLKAVGKLSSQERYELENELSQEFDDWYEWLATIEDSEMIEKAKKMDIFLDDFLAPDFLDELRHEKNSHYQMGEFGERFLRTESRNALRKAMRERAPIYRKERRELWELWIKAGTLLMGIIGVATGFIAVWKK